jgi:hypothetical protein
LVQDSGMRQGPDVSMVADPNTSVKAYDTYGSYHGFAGAYGTSISSPMWAGLIAIADQGMNLSGYDTLDGVSQTLPGLYSLAVNNNYPYYDGTDFHDIQTGTAGQNQADVGYDLVTGLGTPIANNLVPDLIAYETSGPAARAGHGGHRAAGNHVAAMTQQVLDSRSGGSAPLTAPAQTAPLPDPASAGNLVSIAAAVYPQSIVTDIPAVVHGPTVIPLTEGVASSPLADDLASPLA